MRRSALPSYPLRALHLVTLWAYAVSQPVFSLLEANPEFLVVRGSSRTEVVLFALILVLVPPLVAVACELLVRLASSAAADLLHLVLVGAFVVPLALQLLKVVEANRPAALLGASAVALLAVTLYARFKAVGLFLSFSVALPLVGLYSFVSGVPLATTNDVAGAKLRIASQTPIVLLVLDELPVSSLLTANGDVDVERFPNFARLAREGTWYRNATTVHEHTTYAVPAILDGRLPKSDALPTLTDHSENLFTLLGESYEIRALEPVTHLCPRRYCASDDIGSEASRLQSLFSDVRVAYLHRILPESLSGGLPSIGDRWGGFGADALDAGERDLILAAGDADDVDGVVGAVLAKRAARSDVLRLLSSIKRKEPKRTLHFAHLLLPHMPWHLLPSGRRYGNAEAIDGLVDFNTWADNPWLVQQAHQRHLLQVAYTDRVLGRMLDRLESAGLYDEALVVVTSDHGVSFVANGKRRGTDRENIADIARVPLFVKFPDARQAGRIDARGARTIDILPTIADVLGVELPWAVDGRSLLGNSAGPTSVVVGRRNGPVVEAPFSEVERGMRDTIRRQSSLFASGLDALYEIGSNREFLGLPLEQVSTQTSSATRAYFDGEELFQNVRLSSSFVPAGITGTIEGAELLPGLELAVAVNGRIAALTRYFRVDGKRRFNALVPETVFREGVNRVDLLAIDDRGPARHLIHIGATSSRQRYELAADATSIRLPDGRRALIESGRIAGRVERWVLEADTVRLRGWAADLHAGSLPDRILLFASGRLVYAGETTVLRDLSGLHADLGEERAGWVVELPAQQLRSKDLRVFALRGSIASELPAPRGFPWA